MRLPFTKTAILLILLAILLIIIGSFSILRMGKNSKLSEVVKTPTPASIVNTTPTIAPLTQKETDNVLLQNDSDIQATLDQMSIDLKELDQINKNLDSQSL